MKWIRTAPILAGRSHLAIEVLLREPRLHQAVEIMPPLNLREWIARRTGRGWGRSGRRPGSASRTRLTRRRRTGISAAGRLRGGQRERPHSASAVWGPQVPVPVAPAGEPAGSVPRASHWGSAGRTWGGGLRGSRRIDAGAAGGFCLDLADRLLEGEPLARDLGLLKRRLDPAQLRNQGGPRPLIKRAASLAGIPVESGNSAQDQWLIVSHASLNSSGSKSSPDCSSCHASNGFCTRIVSSRSGEVDNSATGHPINSSIHLTYLMA